MKRLLILCVACLVVCLQAVAADICGQVFRNGGTDPGYDAMERQRFVYYMTTEDIAGEHWATILVSAYPNTDTQINEQIGGFYLRVLTTTTNNTNPYDGRAGEWGFAREASTTQYYDQAPRSLQIDGANIADWDTYVKTEYINVNYTGYAQPVKAIRISFKYRGTLGGFRFTYHGISKNCDNANLRKDTYEINFNNGSGNNNFPVLSLDGSCRAMIKAANPVLSIDGQTFNSNPAGNLSYQAINTTQTVAGDCGTLLAATNFSANKTATHLTADEVEWYDKTGTVSMQVYYPSNYSNGNWMNNSKGYAIVSDPKVLDGKLDSRSDGVNRLIFNLPSYYNDNADPLVKFNIDGVKKGTQITLMVDWESVSSDCWLCNCNTCDPKVQENSNIRGYSTLGDKNIDNFNRNGGKGTLTITGTVQNGTFYWTPSAKQTKDCDAIAFSNLRIFACPDKYIAKSIEANADCEGTVVTLTAKGIGSGTTGFTWYESINGGAYTPMAGKTANAIDVTLDLRLHSYYAKKGTEQTDPIDLQGIVCCENTGSTFTTLWKEDFGTVAAGTCKDFPASATGSSQSRMVGHTYAYDGQCCLDGYYRVVSNSRDAAFESPSGSAWPCTGWNTTLTGDHTGNANGAYLVINTGTTSGGGEINDEVMEVDVKGPFCANSWYNFSLWATQISKDTELPCTIVIKIYELNALGGTRGNLLGSVTTGKMSAFEMSRWVNYALSVQTTASVPALRIEIWNKGEVGNGNDLVLDDLQFTTCSPVVDLVLGDNQTELNVTCGDNVNLKSRFSGDPDTYYPSGAWYLWQSSTNQTTWTNMGDAAQNRGTQGVKATSKTGLYYRLIVANSAAAATKAAAGQALDECDSYAITNSVKLICTGGCDPINPPVLVKP